MPEKQTLERARKDKRKGKSASTQAGKFVREEMHHIREGIHGARSTKQAIAIGLSKARRSGRRSSTAGKRYGFTEDSARRQARLRGGSETQTEDISAPLKSHRARAKTGAAEGGSKQSTFPAGAFRRAKAHTSRTLGSSTSSGANQRPQGRSVAARKAARTRARRG